MPRCTALHHAAPRCTAGTTWQIRAGSPQVGEPSTIGLGDNCQVLVEVTARPVRADNIPEALQVVLYGLEGRLRK